MCIRDRYNLLRVAFDPEDGSIGTQVDTLYNAREAGRSVKFPRVSPDGKRLLYTVSDYGNFSIWHKDADLYMLDLSTGAIDSLPEVDVYKRQTCCSSLYCRSCIWLR